MLFKTNNLGTRALFYLFLNHHFACHEATRNVCKSKIPNPRPVGKWVIRAVRGDAVRLRTRLCREAALRRRSFV